MGLNKYWIVLFLSVIISSISQILLKKSANKKYESIVKEYLNIYVISGYGLLILSTLCVVFAYRGVAYKNGPIVEALGYILIMIFSSLFLQEKVSKKKVIGNSLILLGVIVFYI